MENVDTVDVSWLHHTQKDNLVRTKSAPSVPINTSESISPDPTVLASSFPTENHEPTNGASLTNVSSGPPAMNTQQPPPKQKGDSDVVEVKVSTPPAPAPTHTNGSTGKPSTGRPAAPTTGRRNSWISTLSQKFSSSGSTPPAQGNAKDANAKQQPQGQRPELHNPFGASFSPKDKTDKKDDGPSPFDSRSQRSHPSFFHNALRKLSSSSSSASANTGLGKIASQGVIPERRVMNVDQNRDRCKIAELDQAKLRRVAFCVDVEIAGTSRRSESEEEEAAPNQPSQEPPQQTPQPAPQSPQQVPQQPQQQTPPKRRTVVDQIRGFKRQDSKDKGDGASKSSQTGSEGSSEAATSGETKSAESGKENDKVAGKEQTRRQEKKKKSEGERKERKEKKRRQAEANGTIPLQFTRDGGANASAPLRPARGQDQPTTDPVRIYRRCCQLRETGVLKKLVEQISGPSSGLAESPGTVAVLDLTGIWMTLPDIVTFSDWLAVVPVRKLILQNCGLTDEAVRVILAGLLSTKTIEEARSRRRSSRKPSNDTANKEEKLGVIEKLSLKDNPKIGHDGWRHIALFIHMSRSLIGIDLSGIPFPQTSIATNGPSSPLTKPSKPNTEIPTVFANALAERLAGNHLEELVLSECYPSMEDLKKICDAARTVHLRRFGLANNNLKAEGLEHVISYFEAGSCEGLDLGGNNLADHLGLLSSAIQKAKDHPLCALSLADCSLVPKPLCALLQALTHLPNFRFIDLSHNRGLFESTPDSLAMLRRYLPQISELKRIHLADVNLSSEHAIALAEILPDCRRLCHINITENPAIFALASAKEASAQEEACALYASLMTAVRVSRTLIAVDIDIPTADNNEVVKALASQIVAYSLRNLERGELVGELSDGSAPEQHTVPVPDILLHIVGNIEGDEQEPVNPAPDEDYVIGGTGLVKALGVCLGNADHNTEGMSEISPPPSGRSTPLRRSSSVGNKKSRDMSKNLLHSARKIRVRLQPVLVREDRAGNEANYRRLQFLDSTLQRMIQRFEDEFPDTRLSTDSSEPTKPALPQRTPSHSSMADSADHSKLEDSASLDVPPLSQSPDQDTAIDDEDTDHYAIRLSRTSSNTSLHSRALTSEEGRVHRFQQHLRRDILSTDLGAAEGDIGPLSQGPDEAQITALREKLERLRSSEMQSRIELVGPDKALEELGANMEELLALRERDPEAFENFKASQIAAQINAGLVGGEA
ncbi:hypothetical protein AJ79_09755 [Helicocarpus griseus UAMH5409]|uniref:Cell wall biogenesis protein Mhp1 n=1 Tax=Helicocarpus griseus UAMH5409 TaxID=1447875 RepID=A0A2B7WHV5_9EURO|nr:hypothetical protein AJ79_09755 [Helicocarpus griseus UAMH5409]